MKCSCLKLFWGTITVLLHGLLSRWDPRAETCSPAVPWLVLPAPRRGSRRAGSPQLPIVPSSGHPACEALLAPLIFRLISASVSLLLDWHDYFFLLFSFCCTWQEMQSLSRATRGGGDCYPAMQAVAGACFSTRAFLAWSPSFLG